MQKENLHVPRFSLISLVGFASCNICTTQHHSARRKWPIYLYRLTENPRKTRSMWTRTAGSRLSTGNIYSLSTVLRSFARWSLGIDSEASYRAKRIWLVPQAVRNYKLQADLPSRVSSKRIGIRPTSPPSAGK